MARHLGPTLVAGSLLLAAPLSAQTLHDNFADREVLTTAQGSLSGNNTGATLEAGEPRHGGKTGGHSLWISWTAPTNGIVQFQTEGSSFDTLLSAYHFASTNTTALSELAELARADDSEGFGFESEVKFGVLAGQRYEIAVDGYVGAVGPLELHWNFVPTTLPPPIILSSPGDRSVNFGVAVTLTVVLTNAANGRYRWYFNGNELDNERSPILVISSMQATNVGRYKLRVDVDGPNYYSVPTDIQINSDGATDSLAQDKLFDAFASPLTSGGGGGGARLRAALFQLAGAEVGVSRGYNGTQIFNTTYATPDPTEPAHCGFAGGATYWYAYQPPADGTLMLDTIGSTYDTVLAVYTYNPPFTGYPELIPIACDNDSGATNGAARLEFAAPKMRQFLVVVDGINGGRGTAHLNYRLDTNRPPVAPTLMETPALRTVAKGSDVILQPQVAGSAPLHFLWRKGTNVLLGATNSALQLSNVVPADSGDYVVTVSSHVGAALDVRMLLRVLVPPPLHFSLQPDGPLALAFSSVAGQSYVLEQTDALGHPWQPLSNAFFGDGSVMVFTNDTATGTRFFRLRVE